MKSLCFFLLSLFPFLLLFAQKQRPVTIVQSATVAFRPTKPFDHFTTNSNTYSARNAYLTMLASRECYLAVVGARNESEYSRLVRPVFEEWGFERVAFLRNSRTSTQCIVASKSDMVLITFRGSEFGAPPTAVGASIDINGWRRAASIELPNVLLESAVKDWVATDAHLAPMSGPRWSGSKVHAGFGTALESIIDRIISELNGPAAASNKPVYVTGHSLGGALAVLAAFRLKKAGFRVAGAYPHAAPKVGDIVFSAKYAALGIPTFRTVHFRDLVPTFPGPEMVAAYNRMVQNRALLDGRKARGSDLIAAYTHVPAKLKYISRDGSIFTNPSPQTVARDQGPVLRFRDHDSFRYCLQLYNALSPEEQRSLQPPAR
ncbi:MAG: lipase family protein [Bacteroidota bacterium]